METLSIRGILKCPAALLLKKGRWKSSISVLLSPFLLGGLCQPLTPFVSLLSFCLLVSSHPGALGEGQPEQENPEDHGFRPGQRVASDHQDERSRDLRLDGARGHQTVPLLQKQRRVEVAP